MNSTYEFTLKDGPKVKVENFIRTKSCDYITHVLREN